MRRHLHPAILLNADRAPASGLEDHDQLLVQRMILEERLWLRAWGFRAKLHIIWRGMRGATALWVLSKFPRDCRY